jgi:hypothetical protein
MDFYRVLGYFSGLLIVRPDLDQSSLVPTAVLVHVIDAILCAVIANHSRRSVVGWTLGGLAGGIWALGVLFLLPVRNMTEIISPAKTTPQPMQETRK